MLIYLAFLATAIYHTLNTNDPVTLTACFPSILPLYIPLSQPPKASQTCYPSSPNLSNPLLKSRSWPFSTTNRWNHNNRVAWWWSTWQAAGLIYIHKRLNSIEPKTPKISKLIDSLEQTAVKSDSVDNLEHRLRRCIENSFVVWPRKLYSNTNDLLRRIWRFRIYTKILSCERAWMT
jgi:hypothetical protein